MPITGSHNEVQAAIPDPGASGAIPVTRSGWCPLVTAGAETRTLAAPLYAGQTLALMMDVDLGDCVVTCATTLNQSAHTTATFDTAGDLLLLMGVKIGSTYRWRIVVNIGVTVA